MSEQQQNATPGESGQTEDQQQREVSEGLELRKRDEKWTPMPI